MTKIKNNRSKEHGVEMILTRNMFYRDQYRRIKSAILFLLLINCALVVGLSYKLTHPPEPQYFATTSSGEIINVYKLSYRP